MEQGSEEWVKARLGCVTASCFSDVLAKGEGIVRKKYMRRIVAERLTGKQVDSFCNSHTERGHQQEPFARLEYESRTGNLVQEVGFIRHPELMAGVSPDGLIDANGAAEIKSVISTVQLETIERSKVPTCHIPQIQGGMWITGREWWDFVSYSPDLPEPLKIFIFRVYRDDKYIQNLESEVIRFLDETDEMHQRLLRRAA